MEDNKRGEFFLPDLLLVTGFCFLSFTLALKILDGVSMMFFLRMGLITFVSGVLTGACILIAKKQNSNQNPKA